VGFVKSVFLNAKRIIAFVIFMPSELGKIVRCVAEFFKVLNCIVVIVLLLFIAKNSLKFLKVKLFFIKNQQKKVAKKNPAQFARFSSNFAVFRLFSGRFAPPFLPFHEEFLFLS